MNSSEHSSSVAPEKKDAAESARSWCMGLHLAGLSGFLLPIVLAHILVPLTIWLIKRSESDQIDATGKEVLNFQISYTLYLFIAGMLCFVLIGFLIFPLFFIPWLVLPIVGAFKMNNGIFYRYPCTIRFLK